MMDRLTLIKHGDVLIKDGWYKKARDEYSSLCFGCSNIGRCVNRCGFYKAHKRLAEYEDTGLNPDEIMSLKEKLVKLQNECDEWKEKTKKLIDAGNVLNGLTKELMRYCQECILGEVEERDKERKPIQ